MKDVVEQAEGLARRGHDVTLVARELPEVPWIDLHVPVKVVSSFDGDSLPEADVHVATWFPTVLPTVRAARAAKVFHFSQAYEALYPNTAPRKAEIDAAYAAPIPKLLLSESIGRQIGPGFPGDRFVLGAAIRTDLYAPPDPEREARREPTWVGIVGPIELTIKGIDVALRAFSRLRGRGFDLRLFRASQMPLTPEETALCPADHYAVLASVGEMKAWYHRMDLFLHGSYPEEGLGLPPLEAMAAGVPVVMTDIPSLSLVPHGAVLRAAPGDDAGLAAAAESILADDGAWARQRRAGLEAVKRFDVERVVARVERIFAGVEPPDVLRYS